MPFSLKLYVWMIFGLIFLIPVKSFTQDMPLKVKEEPKQHSVSRAAIYSAVLPGLGQGYNRKYWKIPIIYAGFAAIGYFVVSNDKEYDVYKEAYVYVANGSTYPTDNPYVTKYNQSQLNDAMEFYRRNRDLSIIVGVLWYTLNVLEAYVDAHFFDYDISEDLSLHVSPSALHSPFSPVQPAPGIKVSFKF